MARRGGKPGDWLVTDELTGFTTYASKVHRGYYGELAKKPYKRNLQEVATPLNDPVPVSPTNGSSYEVVNSAITTVVPQFVGRTTIPTNTDNMAFGAGAVT